MREHQRIEDIIGVVVNGVNYHTSQDEAVGQITLVAGRGKARDTEYGIQSRAKRRELQELLAELKETKNEIAYLRRELRQREDQIRSSTRLENAIREKYTVATTMRTEMQSLQRILNEQHRVLHSNAAAGNESGALQSEIQGARQRQHKLRIMARDLELELRTKHRKCTDMALRLREAQNNRSPVYHVLERDTLCEDLADEVTALDAQIQSLRETRDRINTQGSIEQARAAKQARDMQQEMKRQNSAAVDREKSAELAYEHLCKLQQHLRDTFPA